jgi:DUF971 family protein
MRGAAVAISAGTNYPGYSALPPSLMQPVDLQHIGQELAIKWDDGSETFIPLETLRRHCPCAGCQGEADIMGNVYKGPKQTLGPSAFQLRSLMRVGTYAVQPVWADGHATGIYSFPYLLKVAESSRQSG